MKFVKKLMALGLSLAVAVGAAAPAMACTGVYVGSGVSENGSMYMGRSEDIGDMYGKIFGVAPAQEIPEGAIYEDTYGFIMDYSKFSYPSTTYAYTYVKDSPAYGETMTDEDGNYVGEAYGEAGQNEKGVSISATVSTSYNKTVKSVDPLVDTGICEISITSLILGGAATAKEGVDLLAAIIDEYGSGECNSIMISDPNETWYFEIVSGHQYAAIKMPEDKVSVQPNIMLLGVIDVTDTENVVVSDGLVSLAQENGFLKTDENGNINVAMTYATEKSGMGQYSRYWQGLFYVNEEAAAALDPTAINNNVNPVDLLIDPDAKLSTMDVLKLLAYRGEGTVYDSNADSSVYAIGNNRQAECHIFETRQNMPAALATIQWQAMADAEFSIYIPYYATLITEVHESYDNAAVASRAADRSYIIDEAFLETVNDSLNWNFQIINHLCYNNRDLCAQNVKTYFEAYQASLIEQQAAVDAQMLALYEKDPALAKEAATALGKDLASQVLEMSNSVLDELLAYLENEENTEPFTPSAQTENVMPVYSLTNVEGPWNEPEKPEILFEDVPEGSYHYEAVYYLAGEGYVTGTETNYFSPYNELTRAQMITILYRVAGQPENTATENPYSDITEGSYYYDAVLWATENGIAKGYAEGFFAPGQSINRQEMATFLYRFAQFQNADTTADGSVLESYPDADNVSAFAKEAVAWAVANGLVKGSAEGTLDPKDVTPRCQAATVIARYCLNEQ